MRDFGTPQHQKNSFMTVLKSKLKIMKQAEILYISKQTENQKI